MNRLTALIVEDAPSWQRIISRVLESRGCTTDVAGNYDDAQRKIEQKPYDIVTLDMVLSPDEEGEAVSASSGWLLLVSELAVRFPGTAIFVISASFTGDPDHVAALIADYGVKGFMSKGSSFDPKKIETWVAQVQQFKAVGGRPDVSTHELIQLYSSQPGITTADLIGLCNEQLAIHRMSKMLAERQQAYYGIDAPPVLDHRIRHHEQAIQRIEDEIARLNSDDAQAAQRGAAS